MNNFQGVAIAPRLSSSVSEAHNKARRDLRKKMLNEDEGSNNGLNRRKRKSGKSKSPAKM